MVRLFDQDIKIRDSDMLISTIIIVAIAVGWYLWDGRQRTTRSMSGGIHEDISLPTDRKQKDEDMKLVTFSTEANTTPRIGLVRDNAVIDLSLVADVPTTMLGFLAAGDSALATAEIAAETATDVIDLEQVELHAPMPNPGKVLAIGLNSLQ